MKGIGLSVSKSIYRFYTTKKDGMAERDLHNEWEFLITSEAHFGLSRNSSRKQHGPAIGMYSRSHDNIVQNMLSIKLIFSIGDTFVQ